MSGLETVPLHGSRIPRRTQPSTITVSSAVHENVGCVSYAAQTTFTRAFKEKRGAGEPMSSARASNPLCVALDVPSWREAEAIVGEIGDLVGVFKVGMELFTGEGPRIVEMIHRSGSRVFLDLKYHDIPNTVAGAIRSATRLGVFLVDVHASGGTEMMRAAAGAAADEAARIGTERPRLLAITVLTSLTAEMLRDEVHVGTPLPEQVVSLAKLAQECGMDGAVASPLEITTIRQACGQSFIILTPGIRPRGARADDQQRMTTPGEAIERGSNFIVVGRPILRAGDKRAACEAILAEIAGATSALRAQP